jgi:hypothetical protein
MPVQNHGLVLYIVFLFADSRMTSLIKGDQLYLTPTLMLLGATYATEAQALIQQFYHFMDVFVPVFMLLICLVILGVFLPQIQRVNGDIQGKRAMLLYLPADVINKNRSIKLMIQDILANVETGGKPISRVAPSDAR